MSDESDPDLAIKLPDDGQPNAATDEGVARQKRKARRQTDRAGDFWRGVLADPTGRAEVMAELVECGTFKVPFQAGPNGFPQPDATWFAAGKQARGMSLFLKLLMMDLDGVRLMLAEHDPALKAMIDSAEAAKRNG